MTSYARFSEDQQSQLYTLSHPKISVQLEELNTPIEGLTQDEAHRRHQRDGPNSIPQNKIHFLAKLATFYWGPVVCMIWVVVIIEIIRKAWVNLALLIFLQFFNGFIAWKQEKTSENTLHALKQAVSPTANVKRDGVYTSIEARNLVIGDRLHLKTGDIIPADGILGPGFVEIDQSGLTGETLTVVKYEGEEVYQGSTVKRGESEAIVRAIGSNTFFGRTRCVMENLNQTSELQRMLYNVGIACMGISSVIGSVVMIVALSRGNNILETISICAVLIIAATPVAMQVVCRTHLAVGAASLAKRNVVVTKLQAIEKLSSINILCCDKSGTLTKNELTAKPPKLIEAWDLKDIYLFASLCSKSTEPQDAIDKCILNTASNLNIPIESYILEDFIPFDPRAKRTEATVKNSLSGEIFRVSKGAPQVILAMCPRDEGLYEQASQWVLDLAQAGYRSLGVARTDKNGKWSFVGVIPMYDPIREDAADTLNKAKVMEIGVKMITGDQIGITKEVARQLELGNRIYNSEILSEQIGSANKEILDNLIVEANGLGEVFPEHKFAIVKILQDRGNIVAFTGKVTSDELAMKKADIGIALNSANDVCKAAADVILTQPGTGIIIESIFRSRKIIQKVLNYVTYRLACTFQLLVFLFITMISINPQSQYICTSCSSLPNTFSLPVISLVLITVLNDGTLISLAFDNVTAPRKPVGWDLNRIYQTALVLGSISFISSILLLLLCLSHMDESAPNSILNAVNIPVLTYGEVLTVMYMKISISEVFTLYSARTSGWFWKHKPRGVLNICAGVAMVGATVISMTWFVKIEGEDTDIPEMKSLSWRIAVVVWVYDMVFFLVQDSCKIISYRVTRATQTQTQNSLPLLNDSFLNFSTNLHVGASIVTDRSMLAVREDIRQLD